MVGRGPGLRAVEIRHTTVGGPVAGHAARSRPVPCALVLRTTGCDCAVPRHHERGQLAPVVGRRAVQERDANHLASELPVRRNRLGRSPTETLFYGLPVRRDRRGRLRDRVRAAHCADGQERRPHGAVRPTGLGSRPHRPIHIWRTVRMTLPFTVH